MSENFLVNQIVIADSLSASDLEKAIQLLVYSLSATSKRVYEHTFAAWALFAEVNQFSVFAMSSENLIAFLESEQLSFTTKKARLSHLRRLIQALYAAYPHVPVIQSMYEQSRILKVKRNAGDLPDKERNKIALARQQVFQAFEVWKDNNRLHHRNRALLAVLFYAGLRRSEAAVLLWDDIDFEEGMVHVRHGKGDKDRTVPFLGDGAAIRYLGLWREDSFGRDYVFCGIRKGGHFDKDKPMSDQAVYNVIKATSDAIGVEFAPHDARRTLLTRALMSGSSVRDMQAVAGHADPSTTLGYAVIKDAREVKGRTKLDY